MPFEFEAFYRDPSWAAEATQLEQRLGAYYFNDPQVLDIARTAVARLRDVLMALTPRLEGESQEAFAHRVEQAFFRDDAPDSAGQVGRGVPLDDLIRHGNVRELMTAFYNAAYFNRGHDTTLAKALLDIFDNNRWDQARAAGLDITEVRRMHRQLDESLHRAVLGWLEERLMPNNFRFARDPFGTGNVVMLSEHGFRDLMDVVRSQFSRHTRSPEEQLALANSPDHYERLNVPLGRYERAYLERHLGEPLAGDTRLPWREGITVHETTGSQWARRAMSDGFQVVDGISATTTRMLTAVKFLGFDSAQTQRFLGALMGWMLPGRDHSLLEIMRGAEI
ncbi:MAG: hypothetical protein IRY92_10990, partial [Dactylosporangium sp.]|nr:hypothetical protein [Dactylosporangium sp.]